MTSADSMAKNLKVIAKTFERNELKIYVTQPFDLKIPKMMEPVMTVAQQEGETKPANSLNTKGLAPLFLDL